MLSNNFYDQGFLEKELMYNIEEVVFGLEHTDTFKDYDGKNIQAKVFVPVTKSTTGHLNSRLTARYVQSMDGQLKDLIALRIRTEEQDGGWINLPGKPPLRETFQ